MIAGRTVPPVSVRVSVLGEVDRPVAKIEVPKSNRLVATSKGTLQRRRLMLDGTPQCVPFLPHEFTSRESDLGITDFSQLPVRGATLDDLDPVERERLRNAIDRYKGDPALSGLSDQDLDGALGLTRRIGEQRVPTITGLLLIGRESALRDHLPTHEVAFQVLESTQVRVNDFYRGPLVRVFERLDEQFRSRVTEEEIQVGLYRVAVPTLDQRAYREAVVNALTHRDYSRLGAVYVRWQDERLVISNPGGFVDGVNLDNLLVVEPRPRNPSLADAFKRIGLAERTGRGVDLIYSGLLRYGRPAPSYGRSDATSVVVELSSAPADRAFLRLIVDEENRRQSPLPIDSLIALSCLREQRRVDTKLLANAMQRKPTAARAVVEGLIEAGLVVAHGVKKGRTYTLSPAIYRQEGRAGEYVRQAAFDPIQQTEMIKRFIQEHGSIRRRDAIDLCRISGAQATRLLLKLRDQGDLEAIGQGKSTAYQLAGSR